MPRPSRAAPLLLGLAAVLLAGCAPGPSTSGAVVRPLSSAPPSPGVAVPAVDPALSPDLLDGWAATTAASTGISATALRAYGYAAGAQAVQDPGCGITWPTLAGIGYVESRHGTYGGATLDAAGNALPSIRGVPLDGTAGNAAIADTDGGAIDGDPEQDRAVGPMQFIPETWARWGVDADGDGVADVDNITDAATTAARYLCAGDGSMATAAGWTTALGRYNASRAYAQDVLTAADAYADRSTG
ncbi:lytic transglycosylase domain-containing protein [Rhodococcus aerolatus]